MSRPIELSVIQGGIQRLRSKGGANPKTLYDLVNGYVTADKHIVSRPGSFRHASLPAGTVGMTAFQGSLHVFSTTSLTVPDGFVLHVLRHPAGHDSAGNPIALQRIHFAEPFLGFLYVVAEFTIPDVDADTLESIYHFWIQTGDAWAASTFYPKGSIVAPTTPNGLAYQSTRLGAAYPSWAPGVPRTVGDSSTPASVVEPTVYNDFFYTVTTVAGTNPASGDIEPDWPTEAGATVVEEADGENTTQTGPAVTQPSSTPKPNPSTQDRYS